MNFKLGRNGWTGVSYGLISGLGIGIILGNFASKDATLGAWMAGTIFTVGGAIIGGIIGNFLHSYKDHYFKNTPLSEKKEKLRKLLLKYSKQ